MVQPLGGEYAATARAAGVGPVRAGYGVEIGLLFDTHDRLGLAGLAQVNLGVRKHRNRSLLQLGAMARQILGAALRRCGAARRRLRCPAHAVPAGRWRVAAVVDAGRGDRATPDAGASGRPAALIVRSPWWDRPVGTALIYLLVVVAVAAAVFGLAAAVFGRGEELAPLAPGATPTRLPVGDVEGDDVRGLRFQQAVRGYRMAEVDWVLERLADELDRTGTERDDLRARVARAGGRPDRPDASARPAAPTSAATEGDGRHRQPVSIARGAAGAGGGRRPGGGGVGLRHRLGAPG